MSWAVGLGDIQTTEVLLQHGADPNLSDKIGRMLIAHSMNSGQCRCIPLLIRYGADLDLRDVDGRTLLNQLARDSEEGRLIYVAELFYRHHADLDSKTSDGFPVLFEAVSNFNWACVSWLLAHGVNYRIYYHVTFLHYSAWAVDLEAVEIVRSAGLMGIDIHDIEPDESKTALGYLTYPARKTTASQELVESFMLLLTEIEERTVAAALSEQPLDGESRPSALSEAEDVGDEDIFENAVGEQPISDYVS